MPLVSSGRPSATGTPSVGVDSKYCSVDTLAGAQTKLHGLGINK